MSGNDLPLTADALTVDWLKSALSEQIGDATLSDFCHTIIGVGEGFMGQLARVALSYTGDSGKAPTSVIAKFAAERQDTRDMAAERSLYQREIGFYRDIGSNVGIPIADCYFMEYLEATNQFVLLLEDLAPGEPSDQVAGTDRQTSREVIEQFAKLHAKWWNDGSLEALPWAKWQVSEMSMDKAMDMYNQSVKEVEETGKFDAYPELKRLMQYLPPLFKFDPAPPYPFSLTHGDLRSDNII
ncbi:MAG: hypothetical protein ACI8Z1_003768, partial [Candidatus Azotimanducaceae bacterium]